MPRLTMAGLMSEARQLKSEEEENPEYDRGILELTNSLLGRMQDEVARTALELGFSEEYALSLYSEKPGEADSVPVDIGEADRQAAAMKELARETLGGPKLYHVVMPEMTVTLLDHDAALEFLGPSEIATTIDGYFISESDVTPEEYDRVCKWRGATS